MDDLEELRVVLRARRRAYYQALDAYQAALKDPSSLATPADRLRVRQAMLAAHTAYDEARERLQLALRRRNELNANLR